MGLMEGSSRSIAQTPELQSRTMSSVEESCLLSGLIGGLGLKRSDWM